MTTRERNLSVAVSAVLGVAAVGFLGYWLVLGPWLEKNRQIKQKQTEIAQLQEDIDDIVLLKRKFEGARQQSLPVDPIQGVGESRQKYTDLLEHMCRRADLTGLKITPGEPDSKTAPQIASKKPAYTKLIWDLSAKGDEYHVIDFLRLFYSQPLLHSIKTMTIQRPSDNRQRSSRELDVSIKIEALVLDNAPTRPTLLPVVREIALLSGAASYTGYNSVAVETGRGAPVPPAGVLADNPPREYLAIAGKNIFFGPLPVKPTFETGPEDDISQFVVLTSITQDDDKDIVAVFRDSLNNNDYTIVQSPNGSIAVKGEYELLGKKKLLPGYSEKRPGQNLLYGSEEGGNVRVWRVRRVTTTEVILERADRPADDEEKPKPPALAFLGGGVGAFVHVPEGKKMYQVSVGQCLATDVAADKDPLHPLPMPLLPREAARAIFAAPPASTVTTTEDRRR
jgi:hypothetical protein